MRRPMAVMPRGREKYVGYLKMIFNKKYAKT